MSDDTDTPTPAPPDPVEALLERIRTALASTLILDGGNRADVVSSGLSTLDELSTALRARTGATPDGPIVALATTTERPVRASFRTVTHADGTVTATVDGSDIAETAATAHEAIGRVVCYERDGLFAVRADVDEDVPTYAEQEAAAVERATSRDEAVQGALADARAALVAQLLEPTDQVVDFDGRTGEEICGGKICNHCAQGAGDESSIQHAADCTYVQARAAIERINAAIATREAERLTLADILAWVEGVKAASSCIFCSPHPGTDPERRAALIEHMKACEGHPLGEALAEVERLRARYKGVEQRWYRAEDAERIRDERDALRADVERLQRERSAITRDHGEAMRRLVEDERADADRRVREAVQATWQAAERALLTAADAQDRIANEKMAADAPASASAHEEEATILRWRATAVLAEAAKGAASPAPAAAPVSEPLMATPPVDVAALAQRRPTTAAWSHAIDALDLIGHRVLTTRMVGHPQHACAMVAREALDEIAASTAPELPSPVPVSEPRCTCGCPADRHVRSVCCSCSVCGRYEEEPAPATPPAAPRPDVVALARRYLALHDAVERERTSSMPVPEFMALADDRDEVLAALRAALVNAPAATASPDAVALARRVMAVALFDEGTDSRISASARAAVAGRTTAAYERDVGRVADVLRAALAGEPRA